MTTSASILKWLLAGTFLAAAAGCAAPTEDADESGGALNAGQPSYVGNAVVGALKSSAGAFEGKTWQLSNDNELASDFLLATPHIGHLANGGHFSIPLPCTSGARCNTDFGLARCNTSSDCGTYGECRAVKATVNSPGQTAEKLCVADADTMVDDMYEAITSANSFVDVASLSGPDGRYGVMLRNAVTFLASKNRAIDVRMIFGQYPTHPTKTDDVVAAMTSRLPANSKVRVNVGAFRSSYKSWNHAKIVAVDGVRAIVGGHNLWEADYLSADPVTDVSIRVTGGAAATAHRFVDQLWNYDCGSTWDLTTSHSVSSNVRASCAPAFAGRSVARSAGGSVVIGVGRLGDAGDSEASDTALVALLGSAKKTIRFSLQDLGPPQIIGIDIASWPMATLTEIVKALGRGVDVYMTLSNEDAEGTGGGNYSNGWSTKDVAKKILDLAKKQLPGVDHHALLCKHLHVASLAYGGSTVWADGHPIPNHSKLTIVDDQAFYVGSQNLYSADLAEFGYIVDDAKATASLVQSLWTPEWASSSRNAVTGTEAATCQLP